MNPAQLITKVRLRARWLRNDLLSAAGWKGSRAGACRRILVYHGIDERGETRLNSRFLSQTELRRHFEWMAAQCEVISLERWFSTPSTGSKPQICLTFDDGYRNNFSHALPLLREFGFPATFFITGAALRGREILWPDHLDLVARHFRKPIGWQGHTFHVDRKGQYRRADGQSLKSLAKRVDHLAISRLEQELETLVPVAELRPWRLYWELVSEAELRSLAADPLFQLGVHGLSHAGLDAMPPDAAQKEMEDCRSWLAGLSGRDVVAIAWPSGTYTPALADLAGDLGLHRQLLMDYNFPGDAEDPRMAARLVVNPHVSFVNQREAILKGGYL